MITASRNIRLQRTVDFTETKSCDAVFMSNKHSMNHVPGKKVKFYGDVLCWPFYFVMPQLEYL